jgi:predicted RNA binding protein YcfA (HicA-like mRNA interferase family)
VRAFVNAGGTERKGKGSHRVVKMPNGKLISLPSGVLKVGLLRHQIKLAGLTEEEFHALV